MVKPARRAGHCPTLREAHSTRGNRKVYLKVNKYEILILGELVKADREIRHGGLWNLM
jgi:hypothetical protein